MPKSTSTRGLVLAIALVFTAVSCQGPNPNSANFVGSWNAPQPETSVQLPTSPQDSLTSQPPLQTQVRSFDCSQTLQRINNSLDRELGGSRASVILQQGCHRLVEKNYGGGISVSTRFLLGSVNKTLDAAIALRLLEKNQFKLDQLVEPYLPNDFTQQLSADWKKIQIRNLLNHTSGIADYINQFSAADQAQVDRILSTPQSFSSLLTLAGRTLWFSPLTRLVYSNTNYLILTKILEALRKLPFSQIMKDELTGPLAMDSTGISASLNPGFSLVGATHIDLSNLQGVGSAYSSADNLMVLLRALDGDIPYLSSSTVHDLMWSPDPACHGPDCDRYGMGFSLRMENSPTHWNWVLHQGHLTGSSHVIAKIPDEKLNLVILSDQTDLELEAFAHDLFVSLISSSCL